MNPATYMAKAKAAMDATREAERLAKLAENEQRIKELEARIAASSPPKFKPKQAVAARMEVPPIMTKREESPTMSITIKEVDDGQPMSPGIARSIDTASLLQQFNQSVQVSTAQAIEKALAYGDKLSREIVESVKLQLAGVTKPRVMVVEIDSKQFKLTKPATALLPRLITQVKLGQHPMLVGPAGSGKSVACEQLAEALGVEYAQICCTSGMSETWLFGRQTPTGFQEAPFSRMFREGGLFNMEEIDAAGENVLMGINTALASGILFNPISGQQCKRHPEFYLCATANTVGKGGDGVYTARNRLDGSSLTRFRPIRVDYDESIEAMVCPDDELRVMFQNARRKLREMKNESIISTRCMMYAYQEKAAGVPMHEIIATQTLSWSDGLAEQVGMIAAKKERSGSKKSAEGVF